MGVTARTADLPTPNPRCRCLLSGATTSRLSSTSTFPLPLQRLLRASAQTPRPAPPSTRASKSPPCRKKTPRHPILSPFGFYFTFPASLRPHLVVLHACNYI